MFATLAGEYPWPPELPFEEALAAVVGAQVEAGLGLVSDGRVHPAVTAPGDLVAAWRATLDAVERIGPGLVVKLAVEGPWGASQTGASGAGRGAFEAAVGGGVAGRDDDALGRARVLRGGLLALAEAGCAYVEVHEPAATLPASDGTPAGDATVGVAPSAGSRGRAAFVAAHAALLAALPDGLHVSLAITGGDALALGAGTLSMLPYRSHLFDLLDGPDSWRVIAALPPERGIIAGIGDASGSRRTRLEEVVWAASYAASTSGRGMDRVGVAPSGSLAALSPEVALAVITLLGQAADAMLGGRDEVLARLDPRAIDARSAALGQYRPGRGRRG